MYIKLPDYIKKTGIISTPITYTWRDSDDYLYEVPRLYNRIVVLQGRSILTMTIGFAEWINWRLSEIYKSQPDLFIHFIEATWAAVIDRRYSNYMSLKYERYTLKHYNMTPNLSSIKKLYNGEIAKDLDKPIEGPLLSSFQNLSYVADQTVPQHSDTTKTIYVSNVAEAVCNEKLDEFKAWRRSIIKRLYKYHKKRVDNDLGVPVPREAIDPEFDYHPSKAKDLINNFLSNLDYESNPFLTHPDELLKLGFEGTPYVYDGE